MTNKGYCITPMTDDVAKLDMSRSTPNGEMPYSVIIVREPEPLLASGRKFVAYGMNGLPLYIASETIGELVARLA